MKFRQVHSLTVRCAAICACVFGLWSGHQAVQTHSWLQAATAGLAIAVAFALYRYLAHFRKHLLRSEGPQSDSTNDEPT